MTGLLLNSLREASSSNSTVSQHKKLDNSGYSFHGRSYGVGASVGLVGVSSLVSQDSNHSAQQTTTRFTFEENGYISQPRCIINQTADLRFVDLGVINGTFSDQPYAYAGTVNAFRGTGNLPTGPWLGFTTTGIVTSGSTFSLAATANDTHYFYGLVGGEFYAILDKIQCSVTFEPATFKVDVDVLAKNITVSLVTDRGTTDGAVDIDPSRAMSTKPSTRLIFSPRSYQQCT